MGQQWLLSPQVAQIIILRAQTIIVSGGVLADIKKDIAVGDFIVTNIPNGNSQFLSQVVAGDSLLLPLDFYYIPDKSLLQQMNFIQQVFSTVFQVSLRVHISNPCLPKVVSSLG